MSIKLEAGKYYRTRDGRKVGPMRNDSGLSLYQWDCNHTSQFYDDFGRADDGSEYDLIAEWTDEPAAVPQPNRYARTINGATVDVYDILRAFNVTCPATQHAIKKLLMPGQRGGKSVTQDLREALASVQRAIEMAGE